MISNQIQNMDENVSDVLCGMLSRLSVHVRAAARSETRRILEVRSFLQLLLSLNITRTLREMMKPK